MAGRMQTRELETLYLDKMLKSPQSTVIFFPFYLLFLLNNFDETHQHKLASASITVVGMGGLGADGYRRV